MNYNHGKCSCKESIFWLLLCFWGICCITFVVFLCICSTLFPVFEDRNKTELVPPVSGYLSVYPDTEIIFNMSDNINTTRKYIETLKNIISEYDCTEGLEDCNTNSNEKHAQCFFNITQLGRECSIGNNFGYLQRKPCIFLRLEEASNFTLIPYASSPSWIKSYSSRHLFVSCSGVRRVDNGRMRTYTTFPSEGFRANFFPVVSSTSNNYNGNESVCEPHSPLVAVQFPDLTTGPTISIMCSVWSANANELGKRSVKFNITIV